ncbi:protein-L-isoaspartate O-methyltransferase [Agaricicola taiwanensis]|uniref:Protein-L-isoaspartate O-methyltransferase n=1 Tax=Agaricicola taiwanensis TaxID=591372 RepID=A0A8J2YIK7_9RHOB|nr:protein-L-isoaspartate(D-aspartate) O-methyltransferase [Agaricicola taiwanensis]GGE45406.1 protein-L-isoaspartate O-methyltransferase [Agaricicola taiwanensis]
MPVSGPNSHEEAARRAEFLLFLKRRGIADRNLLRAMETVPRDLFVAPELLQHAYADRPLPIACGQTISQPYLVAYMTEQLALNDRHKVLEIGTGSGYQTAILSRLARRIYTIDRFRTLTAEAEKRFAELRIANITTMTADGALGWPAQAPFDRIMVTAGCADVPDALVDQLGDDGVLIIPVGPPGGEQELLKIEKFGERTVTKNLLTVRFVPLVPGKAASL